MFFELAEKSRTARSFVSSRAVPEEDLMLIVDTARISPSARNLQRVRYAVITGENADGMFNNISLGGALKAEEKPTYADRAPAYIALLAPKTDTDPNLYIDIGIASEAVTLAARSLGYSTCIIRSFKPDYLASCIDTEKYSTVVVIAVGVSREVAEVRNVTEGESLMYFKENGKHIVPKLSLDSVLLKTK